MKLPTHKMKMRVPNTAKYRPLWQVLEKAASGDGTFVIKVDDNGDAHFSCDDKSAVITIDDPMYEVLSREWFGHKEH